ncbi:MAG: GNAT family N-acetyltransferase [Myxococcota bacterium]
MQIRPIERGDVPRMAELNLEVQALHVELEPTCYLPVTDPEPVAALLLEKFELPGWGGHAAIHEDTLVGFALWEVRQREAHPLVAANRGLFVDQLAVTAAARRTGVGLALMRACEAHAQTLGCTRVSLNCRWSNAKARAFYQAIGYTPAQVTLERHLPPGHGDGDR